MDGQAYISHKNKLIVFWSPKCASSAIFKWFSYSFVNYQISRRMLSKLGYSSSGIDAQKILLMINIPLFLLQEIRIRELFFFFK